MADSIFGRNSYLQDSMDALKRLPAGVLRRLSDTPEQVARGVLGPAYRPTMAAANIMGPQADVAGMVRDAEVGNRLFGQGKYGPALANYGMAAAAVPFMFLPGGVTAFKGGPSQFAPKALEGVSARAERVAALRAEGTATRFGDEVPVNTDYRGLHTAPTRTGKNTLDNMSDIYPDDIYDPSVAGRYYGHGGDSVGIDNQSARIIAKAKANPDGEIEIFRAAPKGTKDINDGDWVTINKDYAKSHGDAWVENGEYDIVSRKVKISDLATDGNSMHEFGYSPKLADDAGRGKTREEIEIQGGALKSNVGEHLGRILDDHNIEWSYHENGGITAIEEYTDKLGRAGRSKKYFSPNASLGTVRNWLGY